MHVGINHAKLNPILEKNGYSRLEPLKMESEKPVIPTETKSTKFRIPKKVPEQSPLVQEPIPQQASLTNAPTPIQQYSGLTGPGTNMQTNFARNLQPASQHLNSQQWTPALPMAPQAPFRHAPPLTRPHHPSQMQPMRAQAPQRFATQFNPQMMATPPPRQPTARFASQVEAESHELGQPLPPTPRPQPMGLWAQSAVKPGQPTLSSVPQFNPPTTSGQMARTIQNPEVPSGSLAPTTCCQICQKTTPSVATLWQHYARMHFFAELKSDYGFMANIADKSCNECGSHFKAVDALFLHIGTVHRKVNEIMEKKGMVGLDMPVNRTRKPM